MANTKRQRTNGNKKKTYTKTTSSNGNMSKNSTNDPAWYAADPALLRDAASIPFSWSLGTSIDRNVPGMESQHIPGILAVSTAPTVGSAYMSTSAVNVASTSLYSYVRHANSGHSNYDAPDLMLYCIAMANVYSFINYCQRLYGLATLYTQRNRYMPRGLVVAQNVNFENLVNNLANFRYWINQMVAKASSLAVPATMSYFSRIAFLYQNVYCEGSSIKDQLYLFRPAGFHRFTLDAESKGMLEFVELKSVQSDGLLTLPEIYLYGEEMLNRILQSEDMNIMSGDILKAYGEGNICKLASMDTYYPIVPINDPMVLHQIKNMQSVTLDLSSLNVKQSGDASYLESIPSLASGNSAYYAAVLNMNKILTLDTDEPDPGMVIEATRLMLGTNGADTSGTPYVACGSEIAVGFAVYTLGDNGEIINTPMSSVTPTDTSFAERVAALSCFKYSPEIMHLVDDDGTITCRKTAFGVDNYAVLSAQDLNKLHDTAIMNMLAVPSIAKVNRV